MKKGFYLMTACLCIFALTACEKEDAGSDNTNTANNGSSNTADFVVPQVSFYANGWPYVVNGEIFSYGYEIDAEKSSKGIYIESADFFWDEKNIGTVRSTPFTINHSIANQTLGIHKLKALINVKGKGFVDMTYTINENIYVLEKPFVLEFNVNYDEGVEPLIKNGIKNGDTISGFITLSEDTSFECDLVKVECYWDDNLYNATTISPFRFSYKVENQTKGEHELKFVCYTKSAIGDFTSTETKTIRVE